MDQDALAQLEKNIRMMGECYRTALDNLTILKCHIEVDDLTHLLRRGVFMSRLEESMAIAFQKKSTMQIMMIDIDHFKNVNDTYGHQTGDEVLERVSDLVRSYLRPHDLAGRYGGEEIIIAVECDDATALNIAERIRQAVEEALFLSLKGAGPFRVTLSLGMASSKNFGYDLTRLIAEADAALYQAKREGRNRTFSAVAA